MKKKTIALFLAAALCLALAACGEKAEETTTLTGMVVSVEGTVITLVETGNFTGGNGGERPGFGGDGSGFSGMLENMETKTVDIGSAHISVQEDGVKASGSLSDIKAGVTVTITMDGKGNATNVLVTAAPGFGGGRGNRT